MKYVCATLLAGLLLALALGAPAYAHGQPPHPPPDQAPEQEHFYAGLIAARDGQWELAEQELLTARALGMPEDAVQAALDDGIATQARMLRWLRRGTYAFVGWLAVLGTLFLLGVLLSRMTLAALHTPLEHRSSITHDPRRNAKRREGGTIVCISSRDFAWLRGFSTGALAGQRLGGGVYFVRTLYRAVVIIASLYFYISLPLLILVAPAGTATFFYIFFLAIGRIPVQLMLIICAYAVYAAYAVARSILNRPTDEHPGRTLSRIEAPGLWALAEEVARRVGARPIDAITLTPGTEVALVERGRLLKKLRGTGRRRLILGLGALSHMPQNQLKAILAHEYGHFSNCDTAGGNVALHVRRSIYLMARHLAATGQTHSLNPVWLFLNGFNAVYLRITQGASRLQELLADRDAARAYGVQSVADALTYITHQRLVFHLQVSHEVELSHGLRRTLQNLYTLPDIPPDALQERLERQLEQVLNHPTSPYDSHPALRERLDRLRRLAPTDPPQESREPALNLLPTAEALQSEMTALIQDNMRRLQHTLI